MDISGILGTFFFYFLSALNLDARSSKIDVLADVRPEVVELAELHALLAKDVVGGGHVEEKVRNQPAVNVAGCGDVDALARTETDGDGRLVAAVDGGLVGSVDDGGDLVDAGVEVGEGLEVVLEGLGGGAAQAGNGLLCGLVWIVSTVLGSKVNRVNETHVGDHVDLEGQGQHVRVKASLGELRSLLGGLRLLEDGLQGLERVLDRHDGGVVDGVGHCERCVVN